MSDKILVLPDNFKSGVNYFIEFTKGQTDFVRAIYLSKKVFEKSRKDESLHEKSDVWIGNEVTINGKYYPKLRYKGHKVESFQLYSIDYIKVGDTEIDLSQREEGKSIFIISKEEAEECKIN